MKFKNLLLIFIIFIVFCSFATINASENVTDETLTVSDNIAVNMNVTEVDPSDGSISLNSKLDEGNNKLGVNTENNLQSPSSNKYYIDNSSEGGNGTLENPYNWTKAYETAVDGDEIIFIQGDYSAYNLNINKTLNLTGNMTVLSSGSITISQGKNVSINNFNINDVSITNKGTLTLNKITMVGNKGILNDNGGRLNIFNSSFRDFYYSDKYFSFIKNNYILNISNTTFSNITGEWYGGVIYNENTRTRIFINNTNFINNTAKIGTAIYNNNGYAPIYINNSVFLNNHFDINNGNVIHKNNAVLFVNNSEFSYVGDSITIEDIGNNTANISGKFYDYEVYGSVNKILLKNTRDNSNFEKNVTISSNSNFSVLMTDLSAGFYIGFLVDDSGNKYAFSKVSQPVGIIFVNSTGKGDGRINNATNLTYAFEKVKNGGIIYLAQGNYSYSDSVNINGQFFMFTNGSGAINLNANGKTWTLKGNSAYMENINFTNITINVMNETCNLTINNCGFYNCSNDAIVSNSKFTNVYHCNFSHNNKYSINIKNTALVQELNIYNSKFINNSYTCLYVMGDYENYKNSSVSIINSYFIDNNATVNSIIYTNKLRSCNISNSVFIRNKGVSAGVFRANVVVQDFYVSYSSFINNTVTSTSSNQGGVFWLGLDKTAYWNTFNVTYSNFKGNRGSNGAVLRLGDGVIRLYNSNFSDNHADCGGVIESSFVNGGGIDIVDCNFYNNSANNDSGVIRVKGKGSSMIINSTFENNRAGNQAGVIGLDNKFNITCINSSFINNSANNGGAIVINEGNVNISKCKFFNNSASSNAGAIYSNHTKGNIIINESIFKDNNASFMGAVGSSKGIISIFNSVFESNSAVHGGAIGSLTGLINISRSDFKDNFAFNASGVIYNGGGQIYVYRSGFLNNSAGLQAGVIGVVSGNVSIFDSVFNYNGVIDGSGRAGVIGVESGVVSIFNSNFTSNHAVYAGVVATTGNGVINIKESNFYNNTAILAGAVASEGGNITINGSVFRANHANHGGAVGATDGLINIYGSNFTENYANVASGAVYNDGGNILINNSRFDGNRALYGSGDVGGGSAGAIGLTNGTILIYSSVFENNKAGKRGGVIGANNGLINISDSAFSNNFANIEGGVVGITGNALVNINTSNFSSNNVGQSGGVIGIESGSVFVSHSSFINNHASNGGVVGVKDEGNVVFSFSNFSSNHADSYGVFYVFGGELNITSSYAFNNSVTGASAVVGVIMDSVVNIENSTFESNIANRATVVGVQVGVVKINNSTFLNNTASSKAGVIATLIDPVSGDSGSIFIYNSTFKHNHASQAGVIDSEAGMIEIHNSSFDDNKATNDAVISANKGSVEVYSSNFTNNNASYAGVIGIWGSAYLTVEGSYFNNNSADQAGVIALDAGSVVINKSWFNNNSARVAGVIKVDGEGTVTIYDSNFTYNHARDSSGVIYGGSEVTITNSLFFNNTVDGYAGVVGVSGGKVNIFNSTFNNNSALRYAGVADVGEGIIVIKDSYFNYNKAYWGAGVISATGNGSSRIEIISSEFNNNNASFQAGVVVAAENGTISLKDSKFTNNSAKYGGVIGLTGFADIDVINVSFINNRALNTSGVILNLGHGDITIDSSEFINNSALYGGVVVGHQSGVVKVNNSMFKNNSAGQGGVIVIGGNSTLNIYNSNFTYNKASNSSGVMYADGMVNIFNSRFENNSANVTAGVIGTTGGIVNVADSVFNNNSAVTAGVIGSQEGKVFINNCNFTLNSANGTGVIATTGTGNVSVKSSRFSENHAIYAGVIGAEGGTIYIDVCEFNNNSASYFGGVVGLNKTANIIISNSNFTYNRAFQAGVIANIGLGAINVSNSIFVNNNASWGGVIGAINGNVSIKHSVFDNNGAEEAGVIITSDNDNCIMIEDSNFTNNKASNSSGVISGKSGHIIVKNSKFRDNRAVANSGVIKVTVTCNVSVDSSEFINNSANHVGVIGISDNAIVTITNSNFTQNNATLVGVMGGDNGKLIIKNSFFTSNKADYIGVLYIGGVNSEVYNSVFSNNIAGNVSAILIEGINTHVHYSNFTNNGKGKTLIVSGKASNTTLNNNNGLDDGVQYNSNVNIERPVEVTLNTTVEIILTVTSDNIIELDGILTVNITCSTTEKLSRTFIVNSTSNTFNISFNSNDYGYGTYIINATYKDKGSKYASSNSIVNFTISRLYHNVVINVDNVTYGENVTVTVSSNYNRTYNLTLGDFKTTITVVNGTGSIDLGKLDAGNYTIFITYKGDTIGSINKSCNFMVSQIETIINVNVSDTSVSFNSTVNVTSNVNGTYNLYVNNTNINFTFNVTNGKANLTLPKIKVPGEYMLIITYIDSNTNYTRTIEKANFNVTDRLSTNLKVNITKHVIFENVTFEVKSDCDGEYMLIIGSFNTTFNVINKTATVKGPILAHGDYQAVINFTGNDYYSNITETINFTVDKITTEVNITISPSNIIQNVTIELNTNIDGKYNITIDSTPFVITVVEGKGSIELNPLSYGTHTAKISFEGNENYTNFTKEINFYISKIATQITFDVKDMNYGSTQWINITSNVDGEYNIKYGTFNEKINITGGSGGIMINNTAAGSYTLNVSFEGNENYTKTSVIKTFKVNQINPIFFIPIDNITYGDKLIVNVLSNVDGKYNLTIGSFSRILNVSKGKASITLLDWDAGNYTASVFLTGNSNYTSTPKSSNFRIEKANTTVEVIFDGTEVGSNFTVYIIRHNANGIYNFTMGDFKSNIEVPAFPRAIFTNVPAGDYIAYLNFDGNKNYNNLSLNYSVTITKLSTNASINVSPFVYYGDELIVNVTSNVDGIYYLEIGDIKENITVQNGSGRISIPNLAAGIYNATVSFNGTSIHAPFKDSKEFWVIPSQTLLELQVLTSDINNVTVRLFANIIGFVNVTVGSNTTTVFLNGSFKIISLSNLNLTPGNYVARAEFQGNDNYRPKIVECEFIMPKVNVDFNIVVGNVNVGENIVVTIVSNVDSIFNVTVGGQFKNVSINGSGSVVFDSLPAGNYLVNVKFAGNTSYYNSTYDRSAYINVIAPINPSEGIINPPTNHGTSKQTDKIKTKIKLSKSKVKKNKVFKILFKTDKNKAIKKTDVKIKISKVKTYKLKTNSKGAVKIKAKFKKGKYTIKVSFKDTKTYGDAVKTLKIRVY